MKNLIRVTCLALVLLFAGGVGFSDCQPCNDPSQLFCPDEH